MNLVRLLVMGAIGLSFAALLGWLTSWAFAAYAYGVLTAGVAGYQARTARPSDVPLWMSSSGGILFLSLIGIFALVSPLAIGLVWYRWWWDWRRTRSPVWALGSARHFLGRLSCASSWGWSSQ